jgi:hypothetical protein
MALVGSPGRIVLVSRKCGNDFERAAEIRDKVRELKEARIFV